MFKEFLLESFRVTKIIENEDINHQKLYTETTKHWISNHNGRGFINESKLNFCKNP